MGKLYKTLCANLEGLQKELEDAHDIEFHTYGGNWGFACNCIHMLDAVCMISGSDQLRIESVQLEDKVVDSKRQGYKEVFGIVSGRCGKCHNFTISCYDNHLYSETVILADNKNTVWMNQRGCIHQWNKMEP